MLTVVLNMIAGIVVLKDNYYWKKPFFIMQWDYLKIKLDYSDYVKANTEGKENSPNAVNSNNAENIPVLLYHGVIEDSSWRSDEVNVRAKDFIKQMFALKQAGWQTITLEDYLAFIQGEKDLPKKSFLLTFDDGRKDSYYPVDPVLRVLDYNAVMFVITNRSLGPNNDKEVFHLSKNELEKMIASNRWEIESHGRDDHDAIKININGEEGYFLSNRMWLPLAGRIETEEEHKIRITADLLESKKDIENNLGTNVLAFAYPFGDFGETIENFPESRGLIVDQAKAIYPLSFCQASSSDFPINYKEDSFLAKRIVMTSLISSQELLDLFEYNQEKQLNYQDDFAQNNGWMIGRGSLDIRGKTMRLKDSESEGSSIAFLGGSYLWKDYIAKANVRVKGTDSLAITARYYDQYNNVSCVFSDHFVSLVQNMNSAEIMDVRNSVETMLSSGREVELGIVVNGDRASCLLDGKEIASETIDPNLSHGGVGFKVRDTLEAGSSLIIRNFRAEKISTNSAI